MLPTCHRFFRTLAAGGLIFASFLAAPEALAKDDGTTSGASDATIFQISERVRPRTAAPTGGGGGQSNSGFGSVGLPATSLSGGNGQSSGGGNGQSNGQSDSAGDNGAGAPGSVGLPGASLDGSGNGASSGGDNGQNNGGSNGQNNGGGNGQNNGSGGNGHGKHGKSRIGGFFDQPQFGQPAPGTAAAAPPTGQPPAGLDRAAMMRELAELRTAFRKKLTTAKEYIAAQLRALAPLNRQSATLEDGLSLLGELRAAALVSKTPYGIKRKELVAGLPGGSAPATTQGQPTGPVAGGPPNCSAVGGYEAYKRRTGNLCFCDTGSC